MVLKRKVDVEGDATVGLPEIKHLPVVREEYCDQENTDRICEFLWALCPEEYEVDRFINMELYAAKNCPDAGVYHAVHRRASGNLVSDVFVQYKDQLNIPDCALGILDVVYEFGRRIRHSHGFADLLLIGNALCAGPDDDFPEFQMRKNKSTTSLFAPTEEMSYQFLSDFYQNNTDLAYECAEGVRRHRIWPGTEWNLSEAIKEYVISEEVFISHIDDVLNSEDVPTAYLEASDQKEYRNDRIQGMGVYLGNTMISSIITMCGLED